MFMYMSLAHASESQSPRERVRESQLGKSCAYTTTTGLWEFRDRPRRAGIR